MPFIWQKWKWHKTQQQNRPEWTCNKMDHATKIDQFHNYQCHKYIFFIKIYSRNSSLARSRDLSMVLLAGWRLKHSFRASHSSATRMQSDADHDNDIGDIREHHFNIYTWTVQVNLPIGRRVIIMSINQSASGTANYWPLTSVSEIGILLVTRGWLQVLTIVRLYIIRQQIIKLTLSPNI